MSQLIFFLPNNNHNMKGKIMPDNVKPATGKADLEIRASWPMVVTITTSICLVKLVKRTIEISRAK